MATVLVVDDEEPFVRAIRRVLRVHEVTARTCGELALALIKRGQRFDLIFCDVHMPGMAGPEFRDTVHHIDREQARRIVFLTGEPFDGGSNRCIPKPFEAANLRDAVARFLPIGLTARRPSYAA